MILTRGDEASTYHACMGVEFPPERIGPDSQPTSRRRSRSGSKDDADLHYLDFLVTYRWWKRFRR